MKKAKPSKGSARTKKFLDGGAVGALAGLGTLAYLMRKKKGESEGSAPKDKSGYSSGPVDVGRMIEGRGDEEPSAEVKRAMAASKGQDELIPEGATDADRATMYGDTVAKRVMPTPKPKPKVAVKPASEGSVPKDTSGYAPPARSVASMIEGKGTAEPIKKPEAAKKPEGTKKRGGIGPYHAFEGVTDYVSKLREGRKRPGEAQVAGMKKGGAVSSASKRADGIAQRGKTRGRVV
jgi:hypothetical protein